MDLPLDKLATTDGPTRVGVDAPGEPSHVVERGPAEVG